MKKNKVKKVKGGKTNEICSQFFTMTKHFIEKYHERVWEKQLPPSFYWKKMTKDIFLDIDDRVLDREKAFLETFGSSHYAKLPFDRHYLLIIKDKTLITVYK